MTNFCTEKMWLDVKARKNLHKIVRDKQNFVSHSLKYILLLLIDVLQLISIIKKKIIIGTFLMVFYNPFSIKNDCDKVMNNHRPVDRSVLNLLEQKPCMMVMVIDNPIVLLKSNEPSTS